MTKVRETSEQWDDVPRKVVGRRVSPGGGWEHATKLQQLANQMNRGRTSWPRGVFRFRSFEEADFWWIQNIRFRK
ncbi:MAG: hypothetical protein NZ740_10595 [Kiritimatiellae bacterium]|nr:hypothetical protein [Kiritimatiellia bacterium]MDW8459534.1 hypothetical protein [Verrucomicrobiota bacterium]